MGYVRAEVGASAGLASCYLVPRDHLGNDGLKNTLHQFLAEAMPGRQVRIANPLAFLSGGVDSRQPGPCLECPHFSSDFKALGQQGQDLGVNVIDACAQLQQFGRGM